jgi:hypothetical protein
MGFWVAKPKLVEGESICWECLANRSLNRWITAGGRLVVTDRRVLFQPNRFDAATGKKPWDCPLAYVAGLATLDRDFTVLAGGVRKRLEIRTRDGAEAFVLNDPEKKAMELRELLRSI